MLKFSLTRTNINYLCDKVFSQISQFFSGSSEAIDNLDAHKEVQAINSSFVREWDLHQGVTDILLSDVHASLGWIFPASFYRVAVKIKNDILFFFYSDIVEEEIEAEYNKEQGYSEITLGLKSKIVTFNNLMKKRINSSTITFIEGYSKMKKRLQMLIKSDEESRTYYLLGSFSPFQYEAKAFQAQGTTFRKVNINLAPLFLFHKRN